jgi:sulfoxide reductase heme-binding subunit YedZ
MTRRVHAVRVVLKPAVFIACLSPIAFEVVDFAHHRLGNDPYRSIIRDTGAWSLWLLGLTLALTPARRLTSWNWLAMFRRMVGLFAFFYAALHTLAYLVFDRVAGLEYAGHPGALSILAMLASYTGHDIAQKAFLLIGTAAFVAMTPLAATSTPGMIRRVGARRWRWLHRAVYPVAVLSLLHHWWPLADRFHLLDRYAVLIVPSLALRAWWGWRRREP